MPSADFARLLENDPANVAALDSIADAFYMEGRLKDAERYFRAAIATAPRDLNLRLMLARLFIRLEYDQQAVDTLDYVLAQDAHNQEALLLLPDALRALGRIDEAHARAKEVLLRFGYRPEFYFYLAGTLRQTLELDDLAQLQPPENLGLAERRLRKRKMAGFLADVATSEGKSRLLRWSGSVQTVSAAISSEPEHGPKIRVGFVCQELRQHPVGRYFLPVMRALRGRHIPNIDIVVYNTGDDLPNDPVYAEIRGVANGTFRSIKDQPVDQVIQTVRGDKIDVLFDLGGHSPRAATWLFEARLVPLQILWLGWGHTMGSPGIDYLLTDKYCKPADLSGIAEKPAVFPGPYMMIAELPEISAKCAPPFRRNGFVTFGQPNRFDKWTKDSIKRDAEIIKQLPGSRLFVFRPDAGAESTRKNIFAAFAQHGIDESRISIRANDAANYGNCFADIDIVLDPIEVSGGATSMDCLMHGVPLLSQVGGQLFQRFSYSFLSYAGLDKLCAYGADEFISIAVALGRDPDRLAELRGGGVRRAVENSPLCDLAAYGRSWSSFIPALLQQHYRAIR